MTQILSLLTRDRSNVRSGAALAERQQKTESDGAKIQDRDLVGVRPRIGTNGGASDS